MVPVSRACRRASWTQRVWIDGVAGDGAEPCQPIEIISAVCWDGPGTMCAGVGSMRARFGFVLAVLTAALGGCGSANATDDGANQALGSVTPDTSHFVMSPGLERIKQHKGSGDTVANQKQSLDIANAYWLGRLSQLVYTPTAEGMKGELQKLGLTADDDHFRFWDNRCTDTQAMYFTTASLSAPLETIDNPYNAASKDIAVLVFRGTEPGNWNDVKRDLAAWNRPGASSIGNVHNGFMTGLNSVWYPPADECGSFEPMGEFLAKHHQFDGSGVRPVRKGAELYMTGHSLGAALATLAVVKTATETCEKAGRWSDDVCFRQYVPVSALVTFGSPRVGDRAFGDTFARWMQDRTPIFRFVHGRDAVVSIPSSFGWYHPGFDGEENSFKVLIGDAPLRMIVSADGDKGQGSLIDDHRMSHYLPVLEKLFTSPSSAAIR